MGFSTRCPMRARGTCVQHANRFLRCAGAHADARGQSRPTCDAPRRGGRGVSAAAVARSPAEDLISNIDAELSGDPGKEQTRIKEELQRIGKQIDTLYSELFTVRDVALDDGSTRSFNISSDAEFRLLGKEEPQVVAQLLHAVEQQKPDEWVAFQSRVTKLKLKQSELDSLLQQVTLAAAAARTPEREQEEPGDEDAPAAIAARARLAKAGRDSPVHIVLITGIESFNRHLYVQAAAQARATFPGLKLTVFSDTDIGTRRQEVSAALATADVFFSSLLFDFDQVEWLRSEVKDVPVRLIFESALELMSCTQVGTFQMQPGGTKQGPPPVVKKLLSLFGSGKEEDKLAGYLSFLKIGPKILKYFPLKKAQDLRAWLTIYGYWNEGGQGNIVNMLLYICNEFFFDTGLQPAEASAFPQTGCVHPDVATPFPNPAAYMRWYRSHGRLRETDAPVAAILLYRKHVITALQYIPELVRRLEEDGVIPVPIFINGVEAHTVVRDQLTTAHEMAEAKRMGQRPSGLSPDAVQVDAVVSTIGFPLVGGPAGSMESGRQAAVAKEILSAKNIPYFVAAPMLIQDLRSWVDSGIAGLQSVVLYSLPELDGAIDTVPLGGLAANNIFLVQERVRRLAARIKNWVSLRRKPVCDRKVALLLYGFPPGVGATGTAALLNVPASLEHVLARLRAEGYDLGSLPEDLSGIGEAIVEALKRQENPGNVARGAVGAERALLGTKADAAGVVSHAMDVQPRSLKTGLQFEDNWGPSEWGPIPFLPTRDYLVQQMEAAWGSLDSYRGLNSTSAGNLLVSGVTVGNVWIGVQPLLGVEGDPMRLLFDRDLTPHPQYAAFYKWLEQDLAADAVVHFGMHGTVEWLPGQPLGNSGFSWSDVLLSNMPNVYIYAANNPSESIIAKRRGYGTIVSHNVPPYGRAGLYKQLSELQALLAEFREDPATNTALIPSIAKTVASAGLQKDCPYITGSGLEVELDEDTAAELDVQEFTDYSSRLNTYLQEVSNRLFSEGLHQFGQPPDEREMSQYVSAFLADRLPQEDAERLAKAPAADLERVCKSLEQRYAAADASPGGTAEQAAVKDAVEVRKLLSRNTEELDALVRALNGEYVLPEAGGDLLRDGPGVLPTGRNIHALDPYRMPSPAAELRGYEAADAVLEAHAAANGGSLPETVAVNLWGLDSIKTRGESVAMVLRLVGARPVKEGTGRIARFELIPLEELGRPRIDVLCNMSGIFRDSFQNVVELLDDMFQRAAAAPEPESMNFVRKHSEKISSDGCSNGTARLFSNPAGDYGSMVNERVGASNWNSAEELGSTWASRNAFSYGRGERGTARPDVLNALLATTERVVQQIDSVEYGLTDIQEYYANTGALKAAAESAAGGRRVGCSVVEAFEAKVKPRELEQVLRLEYRSKLLNPKWAAAMAAQGSGGAFEISQRMTAMLGWGATTSFQEDWTWDQACETYVMDRDMKALLEKNNPQAFKNIVKRMLEAAGRGLWQADEKMIKSLQGIYGDLDEQLEKVG